LTIESVHDIPEEHRSAMGERIFGCDECQSVCPFNQGGSRPSAPELASLPRLKDIELLEILHNGSSAHRRLVKGTALRRVTRDQLARNVAIALGNRGSADAIGPLGEIVREHRSAQVRRHARWALMKLAENHPQAAQILKELASSAPKPENP
jgi:epoxyqueuosine reductase